MLKKLGMLLGLGTLPIFACGPNIGGVVIFFSPFIIAAIMILWALSQLITGKKEEDV